MGRLLALLVLSAGCSFSAQATSNPGGGNPPGIDASSPGDASVPGDTGVPCVPGFLDLCSQTVQSGTLTITNGQTIRTDTDSRCRTYTQAGGADVCLIYVTSVTITGSGFLTVTGPRPLALASSSAMTIEGTIDAGSHGGANGGQRGPGANVITGCGFARSPSDDLGGGGGGAGGSFTLPGGDGGTGDNDNSANPPGTAASGLHSTTTTISVLRGGCAGQTGGNEANTGGSGRGGVGGHSGGALYLFARQSLAISGKVRATGAGGGGGEVQAGGGGGGSGGLVVIESPSIMISGQISANGGGGGQGGGRLNQNDISGNPGTDGDLGTAAAAGGSGAAGGDQRLGFGGAGGALTAAANGTTADFGAGGGGGAAGTIKLLGQQQVSGTISPPPQ